MVTVEKGRRFFPNCSEVLDKFMDDDLPDLFLEKGTPDEQRLKRSRYMELKEDFQKAFSKDKNENRSGLSSSSSSSSLRDGANNKIRKLWFCLYNMLYDVILTANIKFLSGESFTSFALGFL